MTSAAPFDPYESLLGLEAPRPAPGAAAEAREALRQALGGDPGPLGARLEAAGCRDTPSACRAVLALAEDLFSRDRFADLLPVLLAAAGGAADPDLALRNFERFARSLADRFSFYGLLAGRPALARFLVELLAFSEFLADILIRNPEYFDWLIQPEVVNEEYSLERFRELLALSTAAFRRRETLRRAVCRWKRRHLLRIGARDLLGKASIRQAGRELAWMTQAVVELALQHARAECEERHGAPLAESEGAAGAAPRPAAFAVYGMGKLGGEDLNFSSDIDLIFVYDEEGRTEGALDPAGDRVNRVTNHEFFTRLGERLIAFLSEPSDEGILFRVDMRLRPEGKSGPLARSLGAYDAYFASQARPWEKVAYLKARRIAGDEALGRAFDDLAARFVFSDTPPAILIEELARLKRRIDSEVLEGETRERDLKRGVGGIREIEFITSLRQLLTGAARPALRLRPTPEALDALARAGELPEDEAARLRDTYFFLRRLEHRLQMRAERQTYLLPESEEDWGALARRMGAREGGALEAGRALRAEFQSRTQEVHEIFRRHFQGMEATISAADAASPVELLLTARAESDPKPALELLRRNGFIRPEAALRALREMALGSAEIAISSSGQRWFEALLPALLEQAPRLPDPDAAVAGLLQFLRANKGITLTYQLLAARPAILRLLLLAFGCGAAPARPLIAHPEWFEEILAQGALAPGFDIAGQEPEIAREVLGAPDDSEAWRRLRLWKEKNFVILALLDILNIEPEPRLGRLTTDLAEICVRAVAARVERRLTEFHGAPAAEGAPGGPALRWTMLGLGGFGGRRVSFFSDLDVVLIYSGEGRSPGESGLSASHWFSRLGEEILGVLSAVSPEGQLFKMDARLRPEGRGAPLAASLERYLSYYAGAAQTWEWQAALKARRVAGDEALAAEFLGALRRQTPARFPDRAALAAEVRSMRARLAAAAKTPSWAEADFKRGAGGLTDVDFIVQFLQLAHAGRLLAGYGGAERAADTGREAGAGNEAQGAENAAAARREPFPTDTAEALERLADAGILPPEAAAQLREDHDFLRSLQRRQRLFFETSRDFFPATPARLEPLRRLMASRLGETEDLAARLRAARRRIAGWFDRLVADS